MLIYSNESFSAVKASNHHGAGNGGLVAGSFDFEANCETVGIGSWRVDRCARTPAVFFLSFVHLSSRSNQYLN